MTYRRRTKVDTNLFAFLKRGPLKPQYGRNMDPPWGHGEDQESEPLKLSYCRFMSGAHAAFTNALAQCQNHGMMDGDFVV